MRLLFLALFYSRIIHAVGAIGFIDIVGALQPKLSSNASIYLPDDTQFSNLTDRWSRYEAPSFLAVVEVAVEADVEAIVIFANEQCIPFMAVNSRHGIFSAMAGLQNGIGIVMQGLKTLDVYSDNTATFGPGLTSGDVVRGLYKLNKRTSSTVCLCVGIMSPILGGGHGLLQGQYGLVADQLLEANVVLANGTSVVASSTSNADLFWALRGAGHNFGIVTSMKMRVYDQPPYNWTFASITFSQSVFDQVYDATGLLSKCLPKELNVLLYYQWNPEFDTDNAIVWAQIFFDGTEHDLKPHIAPFLAIPRLDISITSHEYPEIYAVSGEDENGWPCIKGQHLIEHLIPAEITKINTTAQREAYDIFNTLTKEHTELQSTSALITELYSIEGVQDVPWESTAVPYRGLGILISPVLGYANASLSPTVISAGEAMRDSIVQGTESKQLNAYINYAFGDESLEALYGYEPWRLQRLRGLKKQYDPDNRFAFYGGIPPS